MSRLVKSTRPEVCGCSFFMLLALGWNRFLLCDSGLLVVFGPGQSYKLTWLADLLKLVCMLWFSNVKFPNTFGSQGH
jgi:hypothetical protein